MNHKLKHKFNAVRTDIDAIKFPSKLEAKYYQKLKEMKQKGELVMFLRQPLFDLGAGVTYRADFIEFYPDGNVRIVDVKGMPPTENFLTKKRLVEALYPVTIEVIKKL